MSQSRKLWPILVGAGAAGAAFFLFSRRASASERSRGGGFVPNKGAYPPVPNGLAGIRAQFGDITISGGKITAPPGWESENIVTTKMPGGVRVRCNKAILKPLSDAITMSAERFPEYPVKTLGGFNPRSKRLSGNPSVHSWGLAIDLNEKDNEGMGESAKNTLPPGFPELWESLGWSWGGRWKGDSYDPMHFQWARGY